MPVLILGSTYLLYSPFLVIDTHRGPTELGSGIVVDMIAAAVCLALAGTLFIASAVLCWRGRWLYTSIAFALAVAVYGTGAYIAIF